MGDSLVNPFIKYILFACNLLLWLISLGVIGFGVYSAVEKGISVDNILDFVLNPALLLITLGSIIFLITFTGCLGALRDNVLLLTISRWIVTIVLILEVILIIIIVLLFYVPQVKEQLSFLNPTPLLEEAIERYRDDPDLGDVIDSMQKSLDCCGASDDDDGFNDWERNVYFNCSTLLSAERCGVPSSCCLESQRENLQCGYGIRDPSQSSSVSTTINRRGCVKGISEFLQKNMWPVIGVVLGILVPQFILLCLTRTLLNQIKSQVEVNEYNRSRNKRRHY